MGSLISVTNLLGALDEVGAPKPCEVRDVFGVPQRGFIFNWTEFVLIDDRGRARNFSLSVRFTMIRDFPFVVKVKSHDLNIEADGVLPTAFTTAEYIKDRVFPDPYSAMNDMLKNQNLMSVTTFRFSERSKKELLCGEEWI